MFPLPIHSHAEEILSALREEKRLLLNAPTGSGKSTGIPPILQEAGAIEGRIIIVQPRRLAARLLAHRVAETLKVKLGKEVGYAVRFEAQFTDSTKILFMTDGVLLRQLRENPTLEGVGLIIFDEFHERRISSDVALGYCQDLQSTSREDLKLLIMSATLAEESLKDYLSPCAVINADGRSFPVETFYRAPTAKPSRSGRPETLPLWEQIAQLSREVVKEEETGNWLIFLSGLFEIRKTVETLERAAWLKGYEIYPLYSALPPQKQMEAIESSGPKIIVSTNVAETSLTIPGIRTVIDSGLERSARYDPARDMESLLLRKISQASATQRAGRAGRTAPGICYRLWSEKEHDARPAFQPPESQTLDLSPTLLLLASLGYGQKGKTFRWLDEPSPEALSRAEHLLTTLGALKEDGTLSETGNTLLDFPLPPRLARFLLAGREHNCLPETLFISALLQGEPLVKRAATLSSPSAAPHHKKRGKNPISDFEERGDPSSFAGLYAVYSYMKQNRFSGDAARPFQLSTRPFKELEKTLSQLTEILEKKKLSDPRLRTEPDFYSRAPLVARAVAETFPDRLCQRLGEGTLSARLIGNKKARLEDSTASRSGKLFYATELQEIQGKDVLTHLSGVVSIEPENLADWFPERLHSVKRVALDEVTNKIISEETETYRHAGKELIITSRISPDPPDPEKTAALLATLIHEGRVPLPQWDRKVEQWISRLNQLSEWMPELELPPLSGDDRLTLLEELCQGVTRIKEVKPLDPWNVLQQWLNPLQTETLNSYAPRELSLTNGRRARITYEEGSPPTISLKLQHLYDVTETPTICGGKVPLRVEILAPNQRPWQITSDLENFWKNGYPQMKKDLAGRYPKHEWR